MTPSDRAEILRKCEFDEGRFTAKRENDRLLPIIQTLLDVNQRLSEALTHVVFAEPSKQDGMFCPINQPTFVIAEKALAFEAEKIGELLK